MLSESPLLLQQELLTSSPPPPPPPPPTLSRIAFDPTIPRYKDCYAVIAHNVLTASECTALLSAAAATAGWERATVNAYGRLVLDEQIRSCDRIIWDDQQVISRVWDRCKALILPDIGVLDGDNPSHRQWGAIRRQKWRLTRPNERMRILKYGPGEFFAPHMDGVYTTPDRKERSFFTMHLYLNDDEHQDGQGPLVGGATSFLTHFDFRTQPQIDVQPKMGSVLIFQHSHLIHAGDELESGIKYTLRTDLMYERV
jgi:2OG-Fe(II) oxygenase superfamily